MNEIKASSTLAPSDPNEPPKTGFETDIELSCGSQEAQASLQYQIYLQSGLDGRSSILFVPTVLGFSREDEALARAIKRLGHRIVLSKKHKEFRVDLVGQIAACELELDFDNHGLGEGRLAAVAPVELRLGPKVGRPSDWGTTRRIPPCATAQQSVTTTTRFLGDADEVWAEVTYRLSIATSDWGIEQITVHPDQAVLSSPPKRGFAELLTAAGAMSTQDSTTYRIGNAAGVRPIFAPEPRGTRLTGIDPDGIELKAVRRRSRRYDVVQRSFGPMSPRGVGKYSYEFDGAGRGPIPTENEERWLATFQETMDPSMAAHLVASLGAVRSNSVLSALRQSLKDPTEADEVRVNAIWALWKNGCLDPGDLRGVLRSATDETLVRQATKAALAVGLAPGDVLKTAGQQALDNVEETLEMWREAGAG